MKAYLSALSVVVAAVISLIALFMPPQGEIDASVLYLVAQFLVFAGTLLGVETAIEKLLRVVRMAKK